MSTTVVVRSGEFVFLPISTNILWEALEGTTVLTFRLSDYVDKLPECRTFRLQRLSGNISAGDIEKSIYPLQMNARIRHFIDGVVQTERDGLKCNNFAKHLAAMLLAMIQVYYPQEEYMYFYSTVASSDVTFTDQVLGRWMECRTVNKLSGALHMTERQFTQNFQRVFGENPGPWLQERRKECIYNDICSSRMPLGEIAITHGFSLTNFIRYCRMNFGETPGAMRKGMVVDKIGPAPTAGEAAARNDVAPRGPK
ncbi:MAG: helix-turn-helix domain-containing protein [Rikenellaceae bacterium]|nr:helix-turn-helix domain-containing protein [Rikenellaceae bacterium]